MKKLIITFIILFPFWGGSTFQLGGFCFAQIIANKNTSGRITITPSGILENITPPPSNNTSLGDGAMPTATTVKHNTAIGSQALYNLFNNFPNSYNGNNNTAVGYLALLQTSEGYDNAAFGASALAELNAGVLATGNSNTAFGRNSMNFNIFGSNNSVLGENALAKNVTGNNNSAFGQFVMNNNEIGNNNVAFGEKSLIAHTTNDNNTAVGSNTLLFDQSGTDNVAIGNTAMQANISGSSNTGVGNFALSGNKIGNSNVAFGQKALSANDGQNNTAVGYISLSLNTTGSNNVAFGNNALNFDITGSGNVAVGMLAGYNETGSNKLYIDNAITPFTAFTPAIGGDFTANKVCIGCDMANTGVNDFKTRTEAFQVTGNAFKTFGTGTWQFPSDRRLKTNIVSLNRDEMLAKLNLMQGVNYELIANPEQGIQYGFIAQDLHKIFPTKVYENKSGYLSSSYGDYVPMFVEALKALNERVEKLEENKFDLKAIAARIEEMEKVFTEN